MKGILNDAKNKVDKVKQDLITESNPIKKKLYVSVTSVVASIGATAYCLVKKNS